MILILNGNSDKLRTCEGKQTFFENNFKFTTTFDPSRCLKQLNLLKELYTFAPILSYHLIQVWIHAETSRQAKCRPINVMSKKFETEGLFCYNLNLISELDQKNRLNKTMLSYHKC